MARDYLVEEKPNAILNIVDGTNIERNLYLTTQLIEHTCCSGNQYDGYC